MSLQNVLLGFLNYGPMTGYTLKKQLGGSTQLFWHAELSQIYPLLKKMEKDGLVTTRVQPQAGRPDKKIHSITPAGRAAFAGWLAEPQAEIAPDKDPVLLRLFFSGRLDKGAVLGQLRLQLELRRAYLKQLRGSVQRDLQTTIDGTGLIRDGVFWELVRGYGEEQTKTAIRWLEGAIRKVETLE